MHPTSAAPQPFPPEAMIVQMAMGGMTARAISEIARLNIPDRLKAGGPRSAAELASELDLNAGALERLMRACASVGIFTEDAAGKFGLTDLSEVLTSDSSVSVKAFAREMGGWWLRAFVYLGDCLRTGEPQAKQITGMDSWWEFLNANPKELEAFGEAMKSNSLSSLRGVLEFCDFTGVRKVVDIGGGFGHLAIALLEKYRDLKGIVLDVPDLIPVAKKNLSVSDPQVIARLEYAGGNMFESVPPADAYVLKHIIHDWDDDRCQKLLTTCHRSLEPNGRLICVDAVLPPLGDTGAVPAKFMSILMLLAIRGKERTRAEWEKLYSAAGFRLTRVTPLRDNFGTSIVEGVRV
jgi:ubiquinone/menaquinone biosynthesis C-methylase UbiE